MDYHWPKYGADQPQPKVSFVKLFKKWNWIIGTGVYMDDIVTMVADRKAEIEKSVAAATDEMARQIESIKTEIQANIKRVLWLISLVTLIVLAIILAVSYFFTQISITKPIKRIIDRLSGGADHVASASGQITSTSQSLAEGSSEQAASLEQSSASLEEMAAMTKQNAANAQQSASSSEEMLSQAGWMKEMVSELVSLVGGSGSSTKERPSKRGPSLREKIRTKIVPPNQNDYRNAMAHPREEETRPDANQN